MRFVCALGLMLAAAGADAQMAFECDATPITPEIRSSAADFGRSFANGKITLFAHFVDANLPNGVLIGLLHPVRGDLAGSGLFPGCTAIYSAHNEIGYFSAVFLDRAEATYDADVGLTISLPIRQYLGAGRYDEAVLSLVVNQNSGTISLD